MSVDTILVVADDAELARRAAEAFDGEAEFASEVAADGDDVLARLEDGDVDALVVGRRVSGEDRPAFLEAVRRAGYDAPCVPVVTVDRPDLLVARVRDVLDRRRAETAARRQRERSISSLESVTRAVLRATDRQEVCEVAVGHAEEILGFSTTGIHLVDGEALVPRATTEEVREQFGPEGPTYTPADEEIWGVYESGWLLIVEDAAQTSIETPMGSGIVAPLGSHGVLITSAEAVRAFDETDVELVRLLASTVTAALDRVVHEERLGRLHEATRRLMGAPTPAEVAQVATATAEEVLELRANAVFVPDGDRLAPVAVTETARELFEEVPSLYAGESVAWEVYETGEPRVFDDVRRAESVQNPNTVVRSELVFPLGDHGVFVAGSPSPSQFTESLVSLATVFADNVEAALDRAARESALRAREAELERQNEHLDEFASVVSHDLRNPLNVAQGNLDLARTAADEATREARLDAVAEAHDRMGALVDSVLTLARQGRTVGRTESVALDDLVARVWRTVGGGSLTVADDLGDVEADPQRLHELLQNLFENALVHAGEDVGVTAGPLSEGRGFYVADDGPGVPPADRERVFERGETTTEHGTGFGLAIVRRIAAAHGWSVRVVESDAGGARFEVDVAPATAGDADSVVRGADARGLGSVFDSDGEDSASPCGSGDDG